MVEGHLRTSLGRAKVLAGGGGSGSGATGLLNAQSTALVDFALETGLGSIGLLASGHVDETKSTRLTGVRVAHDAASVDITVLLEETANLLLGQTRVDTGNEKVGARVGSLFLIFTDWGGAGLVVNDMYGWLVGVFGDVPVIAGSGGGSATESAVAITVGTRGARALARVLRLVWSELVE